MDRFAAGFVAAALLVIAGFLLYQHLAPSIFPQKELVFTESFELPQTGYEFNQSFYASVDKNEKFVVLSFSGKEEEEVAALVQIPKAMAKNAEEFRVVKGKHVVLREDPQLLVVFSQKNDRLEIQFAGEQLPLFVLPLPKDMLPEVDGLSNLIDQNFEYIYGKAEVQLRIASLIASSEKASPAQRIGLVESYLSRLKENAIAKEEGPKQIPFEAPYFVGQEENEFDFSSDIGFEFSDYRISCNDSKAGKAISFSPEEKKLKLSGLIWPPRAFSCTLSFYTPDRIASHSIEISFVPASVYKPFEGKTVCTLVPKTIDSAKISTYSAFGPCVPLKTGAYESNEFYDENYLKAESVRIDFFGSSPSVQTKALYAITCALQSIAETEEERKELGEETYFLGKPAPRVEMGSRRSVKGGSVEHLSMHSWGIAFDLNPYSSKTIDGVVYKNAQHAGGTCCQFEKIHSEIPDYAGDSFKSFGFRWGKEFSPGPCASCGELDSNACSPTAQEISNCRPDPMHFEWRGLDAHGANDLVEACIHFVKEPES